MLKRAMVDMREQIGVMTQKNAQLEEQTEFLKKVTFKSGKGHTFSNNSYQ